jgi:hypothetical protein
VTHDIATPATTPETPQVAPSKFDRLAELISRIPAGINIHDTAVILIAQDAKGDNHMATLLDRQGSLNVAHQIIESSIAEMAAERASARLTQQIQAAQAARQAIIPATHMPSTPPHGRPL